MPKWKCLPVVMMLAALAGCHFFEPRHYHDPQLKLDIAEFEEIPRSFVRGDSEGPAKGLEAPVVLTKQMKTEVALSVEERTPLVQIFHELSRQTGTGMALSSLLSQSQAGVMYSTKGKAFIDVVKDLCHLTDNRFQVRGGLIYVEPDTPYTLTYKVASLSGTRGSENSMSITTDVFAVMEKGRGRVDNGSKSQLIGKANSDFWEELENNLKMLLGEDEGESYTFHKQAGLVTIRGTSKQHDRIVDYLTKLRESIGTQVLIEAKIIEVNLYDEYRSGINWGVLGRSLSLSSAMGALSSPGVLNVSTGLKRDVFTFAVDHKEFVSVLNLVKRFGTVRTLSNPRMTVMNNQPAMLKVATNEVFFQLEFDRYFQADGKPDVENFSSNIMTVPIGLVLVVQPSVDLQTGDITMTLRPTVSRIDKFVEDPAVAIKSNQRVSSRIPVVQVREIDSVLRMRSGEVIILGGLMEDRSRSSTAGIPGVDDIPLFGALSRGQEEERKMTELIIFLTAHIVRESSALNSSEQLSHCNQH